MARMTALAYEVEAALGTNAGEVALLIAQEANYLAAYYAALDREQILGRQWGELTPPADCSHCIQSPGDPKAVLHCGKHSAVYRALCAATAQRIRIQRKLSDVRYALRLAGAGGNGR